MYDIDYIMEETILMKIAVECTATVWEMLILLAILLLVVYMATPMTMTHPTFYVNNTGSVQGQVIGEQNTSDLKW